MLKGIRSKSAPILVVDAGNTFAKASFLAEAERWQGQKKAELIARALTTMGLDGMAVGAADLAFGIPFLTSMAAEGVPLLAANVVDVQTGQPLFPGSTIKQVGTYRMGIIGLSPRELEGLGLKVEDPAEALTRQLATLQAQKVDFVVLLSSMGFPSTQELVKKVPGVDLAIVSGSSRMTDPPVTEGMTLVMEAGSRSKAVGVLDLAPVPGGVRGFVNKGSDVVVAKRAERFELRVRELEKQLADARDEALKKRLERQLAYYQGEVAKLEAARNKDAVAQGHPYVHHFENLEKSLPDEPVIQAMVEATKLAIEAGPAQGEVQAAPATGVAIAGDDARFAGLTGVALLEARSTAGMPGYGNFAGDQACMGCHPTEYTQWKTTPHARAYATLQGENRSQDFECYGCHITGHKKPGGPSNPAEVGYLKNVQCESCHTSGLLHVKDPTRVKLPALVKEETCLECHTFEKTGARFDYATYHPKVVHRPSP